MRRCCHTGCGHAGRAREPRRVRSLDHTSRGPSAYGRACVPDDVGRKHEYVPRAGVVAIAETFDPWQASLTLTSPAAESAVRDVTIQAASVQTGSGLKDSTLKRDDGFNVAQDP